MVARLPERDSKAATNSSAMLSHHATHFLPFPTMSTARSTAGAPDATVTHEKSGISPTASGLKKNEDVEADVRSIHSNHFQHTELARGLKVSSTPGYRSRALALARSPSLSDWFLLLGSEGWGRTRR